MFYNPNSGSGYFPNISPYTINVKLCISTEAPVLAPGGHGINIFGTILHEDACI